MTTHLTEIRAATGRLAAAVVEQTAELQAPAPSCVGLPPEVDQLYAAIDRAEAASAQPPKSSGSRARYIPVSVREAGGLVLDFWQRGWLDDEAARQLAALQTARDGYRDDADRLYQVLRHARAFLGIPVPGGVAFAADAALMAHEVTQLKAGDLTTPPAEPV